MEAKRIRLQGERGISRKTIAQGMPECSGCTCMLVCALLHTLHTRPRVQQAPGIPCSLCLEGQRSCKARAPCAARMQNCINVIARSECDEAIHVSASGAMDCFASLAMTGR